MDALLRIPTIKSLSAPSKSTSSIFIILSYHLTALSETENDSQYKDKIIKILDVLFDGTESDFIVGIRNKASK